MKTHNDASQPRMIVPDDLISASTVANMLGISRAQVVRRVQSGVLTAFAKLDGPLGAYVFDRNDIEAEAQE